MNTSVRAEGLIELLDAASGSVKVLSLDCFDTLVWRKTHAPRDVFAALGLEGGGIERRVYAEGSARRVAMSRRRSNEVSLQDIYRELHTDRSEAALGAAVDAELALEHRYCYGFQPICDLVRRAAARGLQIVVVSDTYLTGRQLEDLIGEAAGLEVLGLITRIFTSRDHGTGKTAGLFPIVLRALGVPAGSILHIGDNVAADVTSAGRHGLRTAHFVQFDPVAEKRLRREAVAAAMIDPSIRVSRPVIQPHRAQIALRTETSAAFSMGHDVLGPPMYAFAVYVEAERRAREDRLGRAVRPLFMMRDGHLPMRAYELLFGTGTARAVELTRLVSARAGLCTKERIEAFLERAVGTMAHEVLAHHLLLTPEELVELCAPHRLGSCEPAEIVAALTTPRAVRRIVKRSTRFGGRLCRHLETLGVARGDAIMLVDLGYHGSAQSLVEPFLRDALELDVAGCYLLLRLLAEEPAFKSGMIDPRHYEVRVLHALCRCAAVLEQLCTRAVGSTVDFDDDGRPIREETGAKARQSAVREAIQEGALCYVRRMAEGGAAVAPQATPTDLRDMAAACLARLFFLPLEEETALIEAFDQDINLGSNLVTPILDRAAVTSNLRHRGIGYINDKERFFVPGELEAHGLPLTLTFFSSLRYALDLKEEDFTVGAIDLPVVLGDASGRAEIEQAAHPTADGFYRLVVPIGVGRFSARVMFGRRLSWLQISSVTVQSVANFAEHKSDLARAASHLTDQMVARAPGLYESDPEGNLLVLPPDRAFEPLVAIVVFRPVCSRSDGGTAALPKAA